MERMEILDENFPFRSTLMTLNFYNMNMRFAGSVRHELRFVSE